MVTDNHYRWDFIQLSTDTKPTPATSPKVADGSTLYTSDDSKLYIWYKNQWYEKTSTGGGGGGSINVINNLESTSTTDALSANMGRILDGKISDAQDIIYFAQELPEPDFPEEEPDGYYMPAFVGKIYLIEYPIKIYYSETDYIDNFSGWWFYSQTSFDEETGYGTYAYTIFKGNGTNNVPEIYVGQAADTEDGYVNLSFTQVGAGGGGETYTDLSTIENDYPTNNPDGIASWNLPVGNYYVSSGNSVRFYYSTTGYMTLDEQHRLNIGTVLNGIYCITIESNSYSGDIHEYYCYKNSPGHQDGYYITDHYFITNREVVDNFISYATQNPLSANRGRLLYNMITPTTGASAPTTSTQGELGKIFIDTTNNDAYMCVNASGGTYTWKKITP